MTTTLRLAMLVTILTAAVAMEAHADITITSTNPLAGEIPEDIEFSTDGTSLFASYFPANRVAIFDPTTLQSDSGFDIVAPTGITTLGNGDTLVATAPWFQGVVLTGAPDPNLASKQGVWRIRSDGFTEQIATLPFENVLPNGIAVDAVGNTYVSNLIGDEIYRVDGAGQVRVWLQDDILASFPFPFIAAEFANQPGVGRLELVPEPGSEILFGLVVLGVIVLRKRRELQAPTS